MLYYLSHFFKAQAKIGLFEQTQIVVANKKYNLLCYFFWW